MEILALHVDELLNDLNTVQELFVFVLPVPVEVDLCFGWSLQLLDLLKVLMLDRLAHSDPLLGIEHEQLG